MADSATGEWGTLSFAVPDYLADVRDAINDFAELLVAALEVANLALEFAKAFIRGFIDPMVALIEAIIDEIMALLRDLKQIGLYITGDWALLGWPPEDLRGGFNEYERRMIARLSDRTDPTRPDVSSKTKVLGLFTYLSQDPSEVERLIEFITAMIKMFGLSFWPDTSRLPIPTIRETLYGPDAVSAFNFGSLVETLTSFDSPPQSCRVTWITQPPSQKHPSNPFPELGPSGYIITVSTLENGLQLRYARSKANTDKKPVDGDKDKLAQPREYGPVLDMDRRPITLHGGAEMLSFKGSPFEYNEGISSSTEAPDDGVCQVFGRVDPASNVVVPLELLTTWGNDPTALGELGDGKGSNFRLQRTFLAPSGVTLAQWFAGEYSAVLSLDDMPIATRFEQSGGQMEPQDDGPATNYYVRVWSAGKKIAEGVAVPQWDFNASEFSNNVWASGQPFVIASTAGSAALGQPSAARRITFVNANTKEYLRALETALLILVLSRSDLPLLSEITANKADDVAAGYLEGKWAGQQFALQATGLEDSRHLLQMMYPDPDEMAKPGQSSQAWRAELHDKIRQMVLDIYEKTGPMPDAEGAVVDATKKLREVTWEKLLPIEPGDKLREASKEAEVDTAPTIFDALDSDNPVAGLTDFGIAPNVLSMGVGADDADALWTVDDILRGREDEFALWEGGYLSITYAEDDPVAVQALLDGAPEGLKATYLQYINSDGELLIPQEVQVYLEDILASARITGSADMIPVYVSGASHLVLYTKTGKASQMWPGAFYLRGLLRGWGGGVLYTEAALALRMATAAFTRSPQDGEWIAMRLFDAFPELEEFLNALENWVRALAKAVQSMADAIIKYIEFVQAQIVELQQLIRRINSFIQTLLSFAFLLPQCSGLLLLSDGTDGLMADLVAADNKPSDSPRSYGAGVAVVVPFGPAFIFDLITLIGGDPDPDAMTALAGAPDAIGIEQIEPAAGAAPTDEPDVL